MPGGPFAGRRPAELADTIGQLYALSCAATGVMLEAVAAYDATEAWRHDGAGSLGQWLCCALGVTTATGAQYARVAKALVDLPFMSSELAAGRLGFEHVRALTRVVTGDTEASLVSEARGMAASEVETMVRRLRSVSVEEASKANAGRSLRLRWGAEDRMLRLSGRFPEVDGAVIASAIKGLAERSACPGDPEREPFEARCADALLELCSCAGGAEESAGSEPRAAEAAGESPCAAGSCDGESGNDTGASSSTPVDDDTAWAALRTGALQIDSNARAKPLRRIETEAVRAEVVVHVEAGVLTSEGDGAAALECGRRLLPRQCGGWRATGGSGRLWRDRGIPLASGGDDGRCRGRCCTSFVIGTAGAGFPDARAHGGCMRITSSFGWMADVPMCRTSSCCVDYAEFRISGTMPTILLCRPAGVGPGQRHQWS